MKIKLLLSSLLTLFLIIFISACTGSSDSNESNSDTSNVETNTETETNVETNSNSEISMDDDFVVGTKDYFLEKITDSEDVPVTYESESKDYFFFRPDGTMAGGGDGGEETMWEANWTFENGKLTIDNGPIKGSFIIKYFPDDGAIQINGVDYFRTSW